MLGVPGTGLPCARRSGSIGIKQQGVLAVALMIAVSATSALGVEMRRGPYLQAVGTDRATVRWRTDAGTKECLLVLGPSIGEWSHQTQARLIPGAPEGSKDWSATIDNLQPSSSYHYAVESRTAVLAGYDDHHVIRTAPPKGSREGISFWVLGDAGTNRPDSGNPRKAVLARNAMRRHHARPFDGILLLGDNAYPEGTDADYAIGFFAVYHDDLKRTPLWPCIGNHEMSDDYLRIFTVPQQAECGGVPSKSGNFYSFDRGNVHVVILDLWKTEWRRADAPQLAWLDNDLKANDLDWTIVINHFPAYCDGKYRAEDEYYVDVRRFILPILDRNRVDLFLSGHDHTYQRSYLISGHHGDRAEYAASRHRRSPGDGSATPYQKLDGPRNGIVYIVCGTAGSSQDEDPEGRRGGKLEYPAMVPIASDGARGLRLPGTLRLQFEGAALAGDFVDQSGQVQDHFRFEKEFRTANAPASPQAP